MNHRTTIAGDDGVWQARCLCGATSPIHALRWEADDWMISHLAQVDRARAHLLAHNPSLKDQRDWYRKQAGLTQDDTTRNLWLMLAGELDHRIGAPPADDPTMF